MRVRKAWIWTVFCLVVIATFAMLETIAVTDPEGLSLSQWWVSLWQAWPPIKTIVDMVVGGLIVHFGWWWVPKHLRERCQQCGREVLIKRHGG